MIFLSKYGSIDQSYPEERDMGSDLSRLLAILLDVKDF